MKKIISVIIVIVAVVITVFSFAKSEDVDCNMGKVEYYAFQNRMLGSCMAELDYADNEKVVFCHGDSMFVYNISNKTIEKSFDLSLLNCTTNQQGDAVLVVSVSDDGKIALLKNEGIIEGKNYDDYILNLETGIARVTKKERLLKPFSLLSETFQAVPDAKGWYSDNCVKVRDKYIYLTCEEWVFGSMKLCQKHDDGNLEEKYVFGDLKKQYENVSMDNPNEVVKAAVYMWSVMDYERMKKYCTDEFVKDKFRFTDEEVSVISNVGDVQNIVSSRVEVGNYKNKTTVDIFVEGHILRPMHSSQLSGDGIVVLEVDKQESGEWLINGMKIIQQ